MAESILHIEAVTAAYTRLPVLREVSMALCGGEIVAVVGPNGSGKSSLLRLALGNLRLRAGRVDWFGRSLSAWAKRELARVVAYLPQNPSSLPGQRVAEVLASGRAPYWGPFGVESGSDRKSVAEAAALLDVQGWLDRDVATLSGGQRQRVFIARAVAQTMGQTSAAILLDEPDTFLDLKHIAELGETLRLLSRGRGLGVLLASHDLNLAAGVADRLVLLQDGAVGASGSADEVMRPEIIATAYGVAVRVIEAGDRRMLVPAGGD